MTDVDFGTKVNLLIAFAAGEVSGGWLRDVAGIVDAEWHVQEAIKVADRIHRERTSASGSNMPGADTTGQPPSSTGSPPATS